MEEIEIWKSLDFIEFPDYEVSNMGNVRSLDRIIIFSDGRANKFKGENNYFYGKKHTEETKQKLREANSKPIAQYTLDGEFVKEWDSATQVERKLGYCKVSISKACKNQQKTAYKFIWRFK